MFTNSVDRSTFDCSSELGAIFPSPAVPGVPVIGCTATPYRMTTGMICGPDNLLNHICFEVGVRELIVQGYLCPLKSKAGRQKVDTTGLHIRGGEFIAGEVELLMDDAALVRSACREIVDQTRERHAVLIFASGVDLLPGI